MRFPESKVTFAGFSVVHFGLPTDLLALGDYDGGRKTDFCLVRRENPNFRWRIRGSSDGGIFNHPFGLSNLDLIMPGDYNGDEITDLSVWRADSDPTRNFFYARSSANAQVSRSECCVGTDYPAANFNVH